MNQKYFSLLTKLGQARIINAQALGKTVKLTKLKVGDGGEDGGKETNPKETDTALVREKWQGPINSIFQDPDNDHWLVIETVIPEEDGNFYITEFGLYDNDDNLIAVGKYPKTYKPTLAQGSGSSLYIRVIFELSNTATVELKIDPAIVLASRTYVDSKWKTHLESDHPHPQYVKQSVYDVEKKYTGIPGAIGTIRHEVFNGIVVQCMPHNDDNGPLAGGDFTTTDLGQDHDVTLHFVLPLNINQNSEMFFFHVRGYSFGTAIVLNEYIAGYCFAGGKILRDTHVQGNAKPAIYNDKNGVVIFSLTFSKSIYYTTVVIDSMRVGNGRQFEHGELKGIISLEKKITYKP
ncbi:phage tail protein [Spartinivicinus poritis]|uniref:Phage tail protein n=1 Tax=Spartinivicinus poritis TaxID=2994640 RepID=A0ABT5UHF3_9GAMM|nr:phage tail protein [Spartinivicinus sp. A2-2]MDE1465800.1 phage tail protein [Spartinivicinus sp. A2-2]